MAALGETCHGEDNSGSLNQTHNNATASSYNSGTVYISVFLPVKEGRVEKDALAEPSAYWDSQ